LGATDSERDGRCAHFGLPGGALGPAYVIAGTITEIVLIGLLILWSRRQPST